MDELGTKDKAVSFRVNSWIDSNIARMAQVERRTKSDMIRVALEDWIQLAMMPELLAEVREKASTRRAEQLRKYTDEFNK